jgi:hypothetical protein
MPTPVRRLLVIRGVGVLVIALAILLLMLLNPPDATGIAIGCAIAAVAAAAGIFSLVKAARTDRAARVVHISEAPPRVQAAHLRRHLRLACIALPALVAFDAWNLHRLETGAAREAMLFVVAGFVYPRWGFWPSIAADLVFAGALVLGLRAAKQLAEARRDTDG